MNTINELANPLALENEIQQKTDYLGFPKGFTNEEVAINKQIRLNNRIKSEIKAHLELNKTYLLKEYDLIQAKQSKLSARCRQFIVNIYNDLKNESDLNSFENQSTEC